MGVSNPFMFANGKNKKRKRTLVEKVESLVNGTPFYEHDTKARDLVDRIRVRALEDYDSEQTLRKDRNRLSQSLKLLD